MKLQEIIQCLQREIKKLYVVHSTLETYEGDLIIDGCEEILFDVIDSLGELEEILTKAQAKPTEEKVAKESPKTVYPLLKLNPDTAPPDNERPIGKDDYPSLLA